MLPKSLPTIHNKSYRLPNLYDRLEKFLENFRILEPLNLFIKWIVLNLWFMDEKVLLEEDRRVCKRL